MKPKLIEGKISKVDASGSMVIIYIKRNEGEVIPVYIDHTMHQNIRNLVSKEADLIGKSITYEKNDLWEGLFFLDKEFYK